MGSGPVRLSARGSFTSVEELIDAIRTFIDGWNHRCQLFTWTKDADTILTKGITIIRD